MLLVDFHIGPLHASRIFKKLKDEFNITILARDADTLMTIQDVYDYIERNGRILGS